jgi:rhodanese-related sulfurtransferase
VLRHFLISLFAACTHKHLIIFSHAPISLNASGDIMILFLARKRTSYMKRAMPQLKQLIAYGLFTLFCLASATANSESYISPETIDGVQKIEAEGLIELVNRNENQIIIDSRINSDRKQGYIAGSISLPDTDTNCESLARLIPEKSDPAVFYCNGPSCRRSDNAVVIAVGCGYTKVYWFRGGIEAWKASNYPIRK